MNASNNLQTIASSAMGMATNAAGLVTSGINSVGGGVFKLVGQLAGKAANTGKGLFKAITKDVDTKALGDAVKGVAGNMVKGAGDASKKFLTQVYGEEGANKQIESAVKASGKFRNFLGTIGHSVRAIAAPITGSIREGFDETVDRDPGFSKIGESGNSLKEKINEIKDRDPGMNIIKPDDPLDRDPGFYRPVDDGVDMTPFYERFDHGRQAIWLNPLIAQIASQGPQGTGDGLTAESGSAGELSPDDLKELIKIRLENEKPVQNQIMVYDEAKTTMQNINRRLEGSVKEIMDKYPEIKDLEDRMKATDDKEEIQKIGEEFADAHPEIISDIKDALKDAFAAPEPDVKIEHAIARIDDNGMQIDKDGNPIIGENHLCEAPEAKDSDDIELY